MRLPAALAKRLPRYPSAPSRGSDGWPSHLPIEVSSLAELCCGMRWNEPPAPTLPFYALVVEAKDKQAEDFHRHHGFVAFGGAPRQLVLPLAKRRPS
jgi:hypothetical protein